MRPWTDFIVSLASLVRIHQTGTWLLLIFSNLVYAGCGDQPANEVDWTNCNFVENLDLIGVGMANAKMSGVNLSLANLEKSQINNSNLKNSIYQTYIYIYIYNI